MPRGGPNRGQGRKPKPLETKFKKVMITLPPELLAKLQGNRSKLIQRLLIEYFERQIQ